MLNKRELFTISTFTFIFLLFYVAAPWHVNPLTLRADEVNGTVISCTVIFFLFTVYVNGDKEGYRRHASPEDEPVGDDVQPGSAWYPPDNSAHKLPGKYYR